MRATNVCAIIVAAMSLSACAPLRHDISTPPIVEVKIDQEQFTSDELQALIGYTESVRLLSVADLLSEYTRVERGYAKAASAADRIKLATLLSLRHAPFRDDARARGLLLQAISDSSYNASAYRRLAGLLLVGLDERRELERALDEERRQRQALGKKLEQLRTIEEEIDRRRMPPAITPRNGPSRPDTGS